MNREIVPATELKGTITPPPDKSISHRSVMFASLHEGVSTIKNFSAAADPHSTISCFRSLGVEIEEQGSTITVHGVGRDGLEEPEEDLDCGNSGTTMRLLSGIVAGAGISCTLVGDESLSARTMRRIIDPLEKMGAEFEARQGDYAPLKITRPGSLIPLRFDLPIPSAQLKSCVLLAGLFGNVPTRVIETVQSRDHTERLLKLGIQSDGNTRIISSSREDDILEQSYNIPGDFSAAAFWLAAGAIHGNAEIHLPDTGMNPTRTAFLDILQEMGANLTIGEQRQEGAEPVADITISTSKLKPIDITPERVPNCIDELPILAVTMLFADGVSRISGAEELRHKETDRLMAVAEMLEKAGAEFTEYKDGLEIHGNPDFIPEPATYNSYHDHRIAMSAGVLSLLADGTSSVKGAVCTAISYPSFWDDLQLLTN
ncbi:3-phosphoshikimate 1-carboxyvinyltransferase [Aliifodinibius sp. S!AR15-10]|uniref:3-phosphoshikimate 1-carboxyvinyltransferase n=1 Tax=Aliifodinibius sp. S!AR15-10 TaxID=2950437 RepID=UPI00285BE471|nr:3-phosphoshikimate 1-carboxyvinyltransferase [Aliifodinibius sp. S!AR15-10]MDR8393106.1 3-phosphoshikimate 1-carboxyvinyltransferase [Aliifodinibius sp. S!AR15-10]